ncbi:MAG: thioredoxin [Elusimicrobium sp.]|jgi:thioredoxin 1|nr:thioredoxin [Elusimicrobium sp.]
MGKKVLTDENFDAETAACKTPYMVEFFAVWCGHCKNMAPVIEELANELKGKVSVFTADVDVAIKKADAFNISSTPTMLLFKSGSSVQEFVGEKDKAFLKNALLSLL